MLLEQQFHFHESKMGNLLHSEAVTTKHGVPLYRVNPSIPSSAEISRTKRVQIGDEHKGFVVDNGTGEILGRGGAISYEFEEVDKERFVKLYLAGLKQAAGLSKAGLAVFEIVYNQLRERPGQDSVLLSTRDHNLPKTTYFRGLRELLDKDFLYRSTIDGQFFVNIRFMFNGDRLAFVKGYKLRQAESDQASLPLALPDFAPIS